ETTPALLAPCIRAAAEASRIENAAQLIEAVAGPERPELGLAALRVLGGAQSCPQKKAGGGTIPRLRYLRARGAGQARSPAPGTQGPRAADAGLLRQLHRRNDRAAEVGTALLLDKGAQALERFIPLLRDAIEIAARLLEPARLQLPDAL